MPTCVPNFVRGFATSFLILSFGCAEALGDSEGSLSGELRTGFESAYVSYGSVTAKEIFVPQLTGALGPWTLNVLGYVPLEKERCGYIYGGEWDFSFSRRIIWGRRLSSDFGVTYYRYQGTVEHRNSFENFVSLGAELPGRPTLTVYYDYVLKDFTGELTLVAEQPLGGAYRLGTSVWAGGRAPVGHRSWFFVSLGEDLCVDLSDRADMRVGVRVTQNTDHREAGNGLKVWYGLSLGYIF